MAAYENGELVVDVWGGLADETTGRQVDGDTLFPVFSVTKAVTAGTLDSLRACLSPGARLPALLRRPRSTTGP